MRVKHLCVVDGWRYRGGLVTRNSLRLEHFGLVDQLEARSDITSIVSVRGLLMRRKVAGSLPEDEQVDAVGAPNDDLLDFVVCESSQRDVANADQLVTLGKSTEIGEAVGSDLRIGP